jgi:hypothetical protein
VIAMPMPTVAVMVVIVSALLFSVHAYMIVTFSIAWSIVAV